MQKTILGLHSLGHDSGAALIENNEVAWSVESERLSRRRHEGYPQGLLQEVFGLGIPTSAHLALSWPYRQSIVDYAGQGLQDLGRLSGSGRARVMGREFEATVIAHELAHAAYSLLYAGWKPNTLILVNEGRGSFCRNSLFYFDGKEILLIEADKLPWFATGFAWSGLSLGLGIGASPSAAGRTMALAGFARGTSSVTAANALTRVRADLMNEDRACQLAALEKLLIDSGIGPSKKYPWPRDGIPAAISSLVNEFQKTFTESVCDYLAKWKAKLGAVHLALGGGCALNIPTNAALERFGVSVGPACNDSGQALGAAVAAAWTIDKCVPRLPSVYLNGFLESSPLVPSATSLCRRHAADPRRVAAILSEGGVVAVCRGRGETGPRSLGNRTLLGGAGKAGMRRKISEELKGREWFRPIAPVVTDENFETLFGNTGLSRYMLTQRNVEGLADFSETEHVDGSARVQSISRTDNHFLHSVLREYEAMGEGRALINTSLNAGGRAMVQTGADMFQDFPVGTVDAYVLDDDLYIPK